MAELYMDIEADETLTRLDADPSRPLLAQRVNDVLDKLTDNPGQASVRKSRFTNGLWAVTVVAQDDEWIILWEPHPDDPDGVLVQYLGPAPL